MSTSSSSIAVYAGTFDPITNGHKDIVERGLAVFDTLYVAVADSTSKQVQFSTEQRVELVRGALKGICGEERVKVESFTGLLVDYVASINASVIVRGLRAVSDYEYEAQMAHINRHLMGSIETVFLVTSEENSFISSSIVKNIASVGGDISRLVPANVSKALAEK
jgi:pantetheine-phosphate adenylyltransferase